MSAQLASEPRILIQAYHLASNDARLAKLRRALREAGCDVWATCPRLGDNSVAEDVEIVEPGAWRSLLGSLAGLPVVGTIARALIARDITAGLAAVARRVQPDVLIVFDPETLPAAVRSRRETGAILIFDAHEYHVAEAPDEPARGAWIERVEQRLGGEIDVLLTVNQSIADLYRRDGRITAEPVVVRNTVDPQPVDPNSPLRAACGLDETARVLLYHGAIRSMRGLDTLIEMAAELPAPWHVVFMGEGPFKSRLQAATGSENVHFLPTVPHLELRRWISGATLGSVLYEGVGENQRYCLPNKVWEYASVGVPMLARDLPELARAIGGAGAGWLVDETANSAAIAREVSALSDEDIERARTGARTLQAENTWTDEIRPVLDIIYEAAGHRGPGEP